MNRLLTIVLVLCACGVLPACAATNSWNGGNGSWDSQNNWSLHQRPNNGQDIVITNTGTFTATLDDQTHANSLTVLSLALSNTSGASTLLVTNRPSNNSSLALTILNDVVLNPGATLRLVDSSSTTSGVSVVASSLFNGYALTLQTNASLIVSNVLHTAVKPNQIGSLTTAGGNVTTRSVKLGEAAGSLGTWTILAGTNLVSESLQIGSDDGTGVVNQTGGKLIVGGNASDYSMSIAGSANSTGTIILAQGQLQPNASLAIGERGFGNLIVSNGVVQAPDIQIGVQNGSHGRLNVVGGTNMLTSIGIGRNGGSTGEVWMTGGQLQTASYSHLGEFGGVGSFTISNGVFQTLGPVIADAIGAVGTMTMAGGSVTASSLELSRGGHGFFWQGGGDLTVNGNIYLYGPDANLTCSGGVLNASEVSLQPRDAGSSIWSIVGGTSVVSQAVSLFGDASHMSSITVSGGRLQTPILNLGTLAGGGAVNLSGGEVEVTQELEVGVARGAVSRISVAGGNLKVATSLPAFIGGLGDAEVDVSSGTLLADMISVGGAPGSVGTVTVSGGLVDAVTFSSGTAVFLGESPGSTGTVWYTGGNLHARTITVGEAGFGSLSVGSNADFQPFGVMVAHQSGAVGVLSLQGGSAFGFPSRRIADLLIGVAAGSTGTVWVTNGELSSGSPVLIGMQGSGRLSVTNSTILLYDLSVGSKGTLECVNSKFYALSNGGPVINNNLMVFVDSTGSFSGNFQNPGTVTASGSTLTFLGSVDNPGTIIATNGTLQFFGSINNSGNVVLGPDQFLITSAVRSNSDVVISWRAFGGNHYRVQATADLSAGYSDISAEIVATGSGFSVTNYIDVGAVTNFPGRIYRVRQVF